MQPSGFHHLAIQVADLPAAERFYCGVLGLQVVARWPWPDGRPGERSIWAALGAGSFLALERCDAAPEPREFRDRRPGIDFVALRIEVADRAAWEARLSAAGVPVVQTSKFTLYVQDPEGNRVGLSHHPFEA